MKELLLLGAEHAHLKVLKAIAQEPLAAARVTLVHPFDHSVLPAMVPSVVAGRLEAEAVRCSVQALAHAARVTFIEASPLALDLQHGHVRLDNGQQLRFDTLSLDTGLTLSRDALPGARQHALFVRPHERFLPLWESTVDLAQRRALNIVVIGGGITGVELALAAAQRLGDRARVALATDEGGLLPGLPARAVGIVQRLFKRLQIPVFDARCTAVTHNHVQLADGPRLACDVPLLAEWGTRAALAPWLADSGLALDDKGRILVANNLQSLSHPRVFALGAIAARHEAQHGTVGFEPDEIASASDVLAVNLRRATAAGELQSWHPRSRAGQFVDCGQGRALWIWGGMVFHGRTLRHWKRHRDSKAWAELQVREPADWPTTSRAPLDSRPPAGPASKVARTEADIQR